MIVTKNFEPLIQLTTDASKKACIESAKEAGQVVLYDVRNGIWCIDPTLDFVCYKNYINLLNMYYDNWVTYGYLDMGLVPLFMWPSFMTDVMAEAAPELSAKLNIELIPMRPVSFLLGKYSDINKDMWIRKSELADFLKCPIGKATLSNLLVQVCAVEGK